VDRQVANLDIAALFSIALTFVQSIFFVAGRILARKKNRASEIIVRENQKFASD
jgi:hypothetical protein